MGWMTGADGRIRRGRSSGAVQPPTTIPSLTRSLRWKATSGRSLSITSSRCWPPRHPTPRTATSRCGEGGVGSIPVRSRRWSRGRVETQFRRMMGAPEDNPCTPSSTRVRSSRGGVDATCCCSMDRRHRDRLPVDLPGRISRVDHPTGGRSGRRNRPGGIGRRVVTAGVVHAIARVTPRSRVAARRGAPRRLRAAPWSRLSRSLGCRAHP